MKAVRLHGIGDLRVEAIDAPPPPAGDQVLVRVTAAGICGSDLHNFRTGQWMTRVPTTPGHEVTGLVEAVGPDVAHLQAGDAVVADSRVWCGACDPCQDGRHHLCEAIGFVGEVCDGGFAERMILPERLLHRVDPGLDSRVAVMAEPLAVALHTIRRLAPQAGRPALVVGCGTIGGLAALLLSRLHDGPILVADRNAARVALVARVAGAIAVELDPTSLKAAAGGRAILHAVEATGSTAALRTLMNSLDPGATLALVGIVHGPLSIDPNWFVEREMSFVGCHAFNTELTDAIALLGPLAPKLLDLIDAEIGLEDVPAAYARSVAGATTGLKIIVRP